jgi:methionine-S-sulfoxide reductase
MVLLGEGPTSRRTSTASQGTMHGLAAPTTTHTSSIARPVQCAGRRRCPSLRHTRPPSASNTPDRDTAATTDGDSSSRRSLLLLAASIALGVPIARELVQDLGRGLDEDANAYAPLPQPVGATQAVATFAGGCFWCMEAPFDILDGVLATTSGYTGGTVERPSYLQVGTGLTGHVEAVQVLYDTTRVSYDQLLDAFWRSCNPTDAGGQFVDRGDEYVSAIFYHDETQRTAAEASREKLQASGVFGPGVRIVTEIRPASAFWCVEALLQPQPIAGCRTSQHTFPQAC